MNFLTGNRGGGKRYFCERKDGRNILEEMKALGYQTPENQEQLDAIQTGKVLAVWADHDLPRPSVRKEMLTERASNDLARESRPPSKLDRPLISCGA
jgi:alkaline phosphatase